MIEVIQTGQFGKTNSIIEMHKVRKFIFKDRMGWDVDINEGGLEIDDYDLPETVYILARDDRNRVSGVWRMLPSASPSMIRNIWPEFLNSFDMPVHESAWEVSRFGVYTDTSSTRENIKTSNRITAELILGLLTVCQLTGISDIYTMYNLQIAKSVGKIGFFAEATSNEICIEGKASVAGRIRTDTEALNRVKHITGMNCDLKLHDLPPILQQAAENNLTVHEKETTYA